MHMGHMRISIIIAIANTFTMSLPSSVDIEVIILLVLSPVKGQLYFLLSCTEKGITFRDLNEKRTAAAWPTPHPTEKIAFVGSVVSDAPHFP